MTKNDSGLKSKIWLSAPHMSGHEQDFINLAFSTNWIAPLGPNVDGFESDLELYLGNESHVAVLSSGTAAIHVALKLLNITQGDEVLCQTKTFVASVNPVIYAGATPIFVDSESETWNMCPVMLEKAILDRIEKGKKPKAIIAINLYGMPYKVTEIHAIAKKHQIAVIEDSAEALGSKYHSQPCGTFGDFSILSFNGNKIITTSGGGALVSRNIKNKKRTVFLATQAKDPGIEYSHSEIGYNYRMSNILAGIGRGQMQVLDNRISARRANFDYYKKALHYISEIEFLTEPDNYYSNRWLTAILFVNKEIRDGILNTLISENIEARPSWKPMHQQPIYKNYPNYLNGIADNLFDRGLCLPSGSNLSNMELDRVIQVIKNYFG
ncbi:aminotransferase class I/II-fold pyridoxal phosphate-dependent enzyme [Bizionia myxarmorum]|uniref:Aminotransferase class I/II-fold pyridoxal phosphate-dependent enzyme n=1 Tax=Bizionia myxarmorum TaxID=291186 RepID=A0A5D0R5N0_9FLAO|nr:aminotransferase class I/II-fold pyridoxal phosphate-dependent enzyme [Bizionia myxarmorum]TYB76225.1 aminotransferase class I/II-fold pyridoxal phosphate-dependent enzyme [Bizionia myxarmorum]